MLTCELHRILTWLNNAGAGVYGSSLYSAKDVKQANVAERDGLLSIDKKGTKNKKRWVLTITPKGRVALKQHNEESEKLRVYASKAVMVALGSCVLCGADPEGSFRSTDSLRCSNPKCFLASATIPIPAWKKLSEVFKEAQKTTVGLGLYTKSLEGL